MPVEYKHCTIIKIMKNNFSEHKYPEYVIYVKWVKKIQVYCTKCYIKTVKSKDYEVLNYIIHDFYKCIDIYDVIKYVPLKTNIWWCVHIDSEHQGVYLVMAHDRLWLMLARSSRLMSSLAFCRNGLNHVLSWQRKKH